MLNMIATYIYTTCGIMYKINTLIRRLPRPITILTVRIKSWLGHISYKQDSVKGISNNYT